MPSSMPADALPAAQARCAGPAALALALSDARARTLRMLDAYAAAVPRWIVPQREELNPPLWEFGHVAWFQERWVLRNPQRARGAACPPDVALRAPMRPDADALYDSSAVAHARRWALPLPDGTATRDYLHATLHATLDALAQAGDDDAALYFFRLCLFHEDMHAEAFVLMAQQLGVPLADELAAPAPCTHGRWQAAGGTLHAGWAGPGFAFDNELGPHTQQVAPFEIDLAPVTNAQFCAFIDDGGYQNDAYWHRDMPTPQGEKRLAPRYWQRIGGAWQRDWFGASAPLAPDAPAANLSLAEAEAWCRWAGRRLPTEWEWEYAALHSGQAGGPAWQWGQVWEWTASPFVPYPGFAAHPYRDYSAPWFGTHRVLRGGSRATHARMKHPRYRNFYLPHRNDIFAGFRSCAA